MSSDVIINLAPDAEALEQAPRSNGKRLVVIILAVAAVLIAGGAVAYKLLGTGAASNEAAAGKEAAPSDTYVEAPPMLVNLRTADGDTRFLKLRFIVVATDAGHAEELKAKLPAVLDALQPFLRELRPEDLNGSAALFRVKEEMMARAIDALGPGVVRDVLIQDLVQQ